MLNTLAYGKDAKSFTYAWLAKIIEFILSFDKKPQ